MKLIPFDYAWSVGIDGADSSFRYTVKEDALALVGLCRTVPGNIVEIGANTGVTTRFLALNFPKRIIFGVDYTGNKRTMIPEQAGENPEDCFGAEADGLSNVTLINARGAELRYDVLVRVGAIFIDGDHSYQGVKADTENALRYFLRNPQPDAGRLLLWHDAHPDETWSGVHRYLLELEREHGWTIQRVDAGSKSLAFVDLSNEPY